MPLPQIFLHLSFHSCSSQDSEVPAKTFPLLINPCKFLPHVTSPCTQMTRLAALPKTLSTGQSLLGVYFMYTPKSPYSSSDIRVQFST